MSKRVQRYFVAIGLFVILLFVLDVDESFRRFLTDVANQLTPPAEAEGW